jgi:ribose transport system ATP-binding protein
MTRRVRQQHPPGRIEDVAASYAADRLMDEQVILRAEHITMDFPGVRALNEVDFALHRGEIHAIVGENGAGKSTLIKIIGGVYRSTSGRVVLYGEETRIGDPREAQILGVRVIHQELNLLPLLTAAENICLGNLPGGRIPGSVSWRELKREAEKILSRMQVRLDLETPAGRLSAGEQQIVEIAQALTTDVRILIMDEPTAALNRSEVQKLFDLLRGMAKEGVGIVYITHRISEVFEIADRVTVLRDGVCIGSMLVKETNENELIQMMVGRTLDEMYPRKWGEPTEVLLEAVNLSTKDGLEDICFTLRAGEILGVYGLMGSGRSRLSRALFGVAPIGGGELLVHGQPVSSLTPHGARRLGLGYLPSDRKAEALIMPFSVRKNLTIANLDKYSRGPFLADSEEMASARDWVDALRISTPSVEASIASLSGGSQQKVIVGRWLDARTRVLIVNEPTRGIDVGAKLDIYRLLDDLCRSGVGVLMFSSEMPELLAMADRILVMSSGRITGELAHGQANQEILFERAIARG